MSGTKIYSDHEDGFILRGRLRLQSRANATHDDLDYLKDRLLEAHILACESYCEREGKNFFEVWDGLNSAFLTSLTRDVLEYEKKANQKEIAAKTAAVAPVSSNS